MDEAARVRLKKAIKSSGHNAKEICNTLKYPSNYLYRLTSGHIKSPSAERLQQICGYIGVSVSFILTGEDAPQEREDLLKDLSNAPDDVIDAVSKFVHQQGWMKP